MYTCTPSLYYISETVLLPVHGFLYPAFLATPEHTYKYGIREEYESYIYENMSLWLKFECESE